MKVIVLGAGLVGRPMAIDLSQDSTFDVTVADINQGALDQLHADHDSIQVRCEDLSKPERVKEVVADYDIVLNAVPGFMGYQTLIAIIESKKNVIDIAFCPEDVLELDALARRHLERGAQARVLVLGARELDLEADDAVDDPL